MDRRARIGVLSTDRRRWCWSFLAPLLYIGVCGAQTVTTYSYDNLKRVTQASSTDGTSVQYQYDANGNLLTVNRTNASALTLDKSLSVNLAAAGQSATLNFSATAGENATLNLASISASPAGSSITVSVYNSSGTLVATTSATASGILPLSNLSAGNYSVVLTPQSGTTAALQVTLASIPATSPADTGDAPLPIWALFALGSGLFGILNRQGWRSRGAQVGK